MGADKARNSAGGAQQQATNAVSSPSQEEDPPKIRVIVRKRPMNRKVRVSQSESPNFRTRSASLYCMSNTTLQEKERGEDDIVDCLMERSCIIVNETKLKVDLTKYTEKHQVRIKLPPNSAFSSGME